MTARRIVFVCVENACRSQMAQGFARSALAESSPTLQVLSAGSRPRGSVDARAIKFMGELGIDISDQTSKGLDALGDAQFDAVVTMGCGDACPALRGRIREDWALEDPKSLDDEGFRRVRDEIQRRVADLLRRV